MPGKAPSRNSLTIVLAVSRVGDSATVTEPVWSWGVDVRVFPQAVPSVSSIRPVAWLVPSSPVEAAIVAPLVAEARFCWIVTTLPVIAPAVMVIPVNVREPQHAPRPEGRRKEPKSRRKSGRGQHGLSPVVEPDERGKRHSSDRSECDQRRLGPKDGPEAKRADRRQGRARPVDIEDRRLARCF